MNMAKKAHFIGIGGIGMSALARLMKHEKWQVSGSDIEDKPLLDDLRAEGIDIMIGQIKENISDDVDLFVYSEAVHDDNPELAAARATGKKTVNLFKALAEYVNPYYLIAVSGTHGKTTTVAMLTDIFEAAGKDPTAFIGSLRSKTKKNYRVGKSKYAIVEACEYKDDFLSLTPDVLVITNLEYEHVDHYADLAAVQATFKKLVAQVHETGCVIADTANPNLAPVLEGAHVPVIDYKTFLDVAMPLKVPGLHNRLNAAATLAVAKREGIGEVPAKSALADFAGTWRRFEYKGEVNGAPVYDDYAHHPTEIAATIAGARELYPDKKLHVVFQSHTYSRTKALFNDFAKALGQADRVIVAPIYAAREENTFNVSARELAVKTLEYCPDSHFIESFDDIVRTIQGSVGQDDVVLVLGAGNITNIASELTK